MEQLLFGISGLPLEKDKMKFNYASAIEYLKEIGIDVMEFPFVRSINVTDKNKDAILANKIKNNFHLTAHGSYYINLNAKEEEKITKSLERIINGAKALLKVNGNNIVFHPGYYLGDSKEKTYDTIKHNLEKLPYIGVNYRLETTGKATQFGSLEEIVSICREVPLCKPCIDFAHIHARDNGCLKDQDDFNRILEYIGDNLGKEALSEMHIHISGINYGIKGEKNHLPLQESDFNFMAFMKALVKYDVKGYIISESPILEEDSLLLKSIYNQS
ncbi:TIM barrel protein [Alloiococcus sp. CFN-8]|uniref:TIM barrel protein n=1 Tax=Alloiococcus sp. CFN-8 TaxID=3416081 RepID=UPI003CE9B9A3